MSINLESIFEENDVSLEELPIESLISSTSDHTAINFDRFFDDHLAALIEQNGVKDDDLDESVLDLDVNNVEQLVNNEDSILELDDCIDDPFETLDYEYNTNNENVKVDDKPIKTTVRRQSTRIQDQLRKNIAEQIQRENIRIEKEAHLLTKKKNNKPKTKKDIPSHSIDEKAEDNHISDIDGVNSTIDEFDITDIDEDDPNKLWCICQEPYGYRFMICCDICANWFHGDCVGVSQIQGAEMEKSGEDFICPQCVSQQKTDPQQVIEDPPLIVNELDNGPRLQLKIVPLEFELQQKSTFKLPFKSSNIFQILSTDNTVIIDEDNSTAEEKKSEQKKDLDGDDDECVIITDVTYEKPATYKQKNNRTDACLNPNCKELINPKISLYCSKTCLKKYSRIVIKANRKDKTTQYGLTKGLRLAKMTRFVVAQVEREFIQNEFESPTEENLREFLIKNPTFKVFQSVKGGTETEPTRKPKRIPIKKQQPQQFQDNVKDTKSSGNNSSAITEVNGANEMKIQACKRVKVVKHFSLYIQNQFNSKQSKSSFKLPDFRRIWDYCVQLEDCIFQQCSHAPIIANNETATTSSKTQLDNNQYESRIKDIRHIFQSDPTVLSNFLRGRISAHNLVNGVQLSTEDGKYRTELLIDEDNDSYSHISGNAKDIRTNNTTSNSVTNSLSTTNVNHSNMAGSASVSKLLSEDNTHLHEQHLYDISCRICNRTNDQKKKVAEETPVYNSTQKATSELNDENKVSTSVRTPEMDMDISEPEEADNEITKLKDTPKNITKPVNSILESVTPKKDDPSESNQKEQAELQQAQKNKLVPMWSGEVIYKEVGNVECKAYLISRLLLGATDDKQYKIRPKDSQESLRDSINLSVNIDKHVLMNGRVIMEVVESYLKKLRRHSNKEFLLFRLHPSNLETGRQTYQNIFQELYSRNRCGVINTKRAGLKDCYIYPLNAHSKLPSFLLPFNGPGLERKRPHLLLLIVVRTPIDDMVLFKPISPKYDENHELDNKHGINFDNNIYNNANTIRSLWSNKTNSETPTIINTPDSNKPTDEYAIKTPISFVLDDTSTVTDTHTDVNPPVEPDASVNDKLEQIKPEDIPIPASISVENIPMPDFSPVKSKSEQKSDSKSKKEDKKAEKKTKNELSEEKRKHSASKSPIYRRNGIKRNRTRSKSRSKPRFDYLFDQNRHKDSRDSRPTRRKYKRKSLSSSSVSTSSSSSPPSQSHLSSTNHKTTKIITTKPMVNLSGVTYFSPNPNIPKVTRSDADIDLRSLNSSQPIKNLNNVTRNNIRVSNRKYTYYEPDPDKSMDFFYSPFVCTLTEDRVVPLLPPNDESKTIVSPDQPFDLDLRSHVLQQQDLNNTPDPSNNQFEVLPNNSGQDTNGLRELPSDEHVSINNTKPEQPSFDFYDAFPAHHQRYRHKPRGLLYNRFTLYSPPSRTFENNHAVFDQEDGGDYYG